MKFSLIVFYDSEAEIEWFCIQGVFINISNQVCVVLLTNNAYVLSSKDWNHLNQKVNENENLGDYWYHPSKNSLKCWFIFVSQANWMAKNILAFYKLPDFYFQIIQFHFQV